MRTGRPPLEWGTHGEITTRTVASGYVRASARVRLWDGELQRMTATASTASDARASLQHRIAERLRFSELDAWRYLTPDDPFIIDSLGWTLFRRGNTGGALEQLQKAYGLRPDPEIAAHLGEVLWALGRRDEAARIWRDAAKANPDSSVLVDVIKKFKP